MTMTYSGINVQTDKFGHVYETKKFELPNLGKAGLLTMAGVGICALPFYPVVTLCMAVGGIAGGVLGKELGTYVMHQQAAQNRSLRSIPDCYYPQQFFQTRNKIKTAVAVTCCTLGAALGFEFNKTSVLQPENAAMTTVMAKENAAPDFLEKTMTWQAALTNSQANSKSNPMAYTLFQ